MAEVERTADAALQALLELRGSELQQLDECTRDILSETLVREIFKQAWRYRFEEDRRQPRRAVRELVSDAIKERWLGEE